MHFITLIIHCLIQQYSIIFSLFFLSEDCKIIAIKLFCMLYKLSPYLLSQEHSANATTTHYEVKPLYDGSSYSSVDGKSIPSAYFMKTQEQNGLCNLIANWKCKYKRCAFVIIMTTIKHKAIHLLQKIFLINLYIHIKQPFKIDLLPNPTSGLSSFDTKYLVCTNLASIQVPTVL